MTIRRMAEIRRHARQLEPDAAIGFMHSAFILMLFALTGTAVPVVGSERTAYDHYRTRPMQRALLWATAPFLRRLTVNGERVRSGFPPRIASRMVVIPNPVALAEAVADPVGPRVKTLLSVGGLRPEKGHETLVGSFAKIADRFPDWRLRIVGGGPLRAELAGQVAGLGLADRVQLAGPARAVEREYRAAQLFVLPSRYEAFPNCLAEALAHGLPAVGFADCAGTNALILPGVNGELAGGGDRVDALSKCLARLMGCPSLRHSYGANAPATVSAYSLPAVIDQWEALLADAVAPGRLPDKLH
jgi:glycosyltransferase involved in cell wall biosynthesis